MSNLSEKLTASAKMTNKFILAQNYSQCVQSVQTVYNLAPHWSKLGQCPLDRPIIVNTCVNHWIRPICSIKTVISGWPCCVGLYPRCRTYAAVMTAVRGMTSVVHIYRDECNSDVWSTNVKSHFADVILTYRIIFSLVDVCMSDYFQLMSADGDRTVTSGNPFKLSVNYCRTNTRKNF